MWKSGPIFRYLRSRTWGDFDKRVWVILGVDVDELRSSKAANSGYHRTSCGHFSSFCKPFKDTALRSKILVKCNRSKLPPEQQSPKNRWETWKCIEKLGNVTIMMDRSSTSECRRVGYAVQQLRVKCSMWKSRLESTIRQISSKFCASTIETS
jgi:hypothetical protein